MGSNELIVLDARSPRLRETLQAHFEAERMRLLTGFFLRGACGFGVPLWISAAWPELVPVGLRHLALLAWLFWAVGTVWSAVVERRWRQRTERTIEP